MVLFFTNRGICLLKKYETSIDDDWVYWSCKMSKHPELLTLATALKMSES